MRIAFLGSIGLALVVGWPLATAAAAETCGSLYEEIQGEGDAADVGKLKTFYERAAVLADCDSEFRIALGRRVAVALVSGVENALKAGADAKGQLAVLEESLRYHRIWQVLAMLGDIARDDGDHAKAALRFQETLQTIDDPALTKLAPPKDVIETLVKKAETARLLSKTYVAAPRTRGKATGLGALGVRGFKIKKVAVPITFVFGKTEFTDKGTAAAADMLEQLKSQGQPDITLVGHTDPVGADASNQSLSEQRAEAVRTFLHEADYKGRIETMGRGETEQFKPDDPGRYTEEQLHQMSRRVELVR